MLILYTYSQKEAFSIGMQQVYTCATNEATHIFKDGQVQKNIT